MKNGQEGNISDFPTPDELWNKTHLVLPADQNEWKEKFDNVPNEGEYGKCLETCLETSNVYNQNVCLETSNVYNQNVYNH